MTRAMKTVLLALVAPALFGACGADDPPASPPDEGTPRAHKGAVHVLFDGGTRRVELALDEGYPRAALGTRFALTLAGEAEAQAFSIAIVIDPIKETPSYSFPADRDQLQLSMARGAQALRLGTVSGFLQLTALDERNEPGSAVVSLTVSDTAGYALAEVDMTLGSTPAP